MYVYFVVIRAIARFVYPSERHMVTRFVSCNMREICRGRTVCLLWSYTSEIAPPVGHEKVSSLPIPDTNLDGTWGVDRACAKLGTLTRLRCFLLPWLVWWQGQVQASSLCALPHVKDRSGCVISSSARKADHIQPRSGGLQHVRQMT